jgi:hypothetical protein
LDDGGAEVTVASVGADEGRLGSSISVTSFGISSLSAQNKATTLRLTLVKTSGAERKKKEKVKTTMAQSLDFNS